MKYIKIFSLLLLITLFQNSDAQYSQPLQVVSSGGGESGNVNYKNFGVLGETFFKDCDSISTGDYKTSMGFFNDLVCGIYTSISDYETSLNNIHIFPNPITTNLFIERQNHQEIRISIFNTLGQKVFTSEIETNSETINISILVRGLYFVVLRDLIGNILLSEKIIKE